MYSPTFIYSLYKIKLTVANINNAIINMFVVFKCQNEDLRLKQVPIFISGDQSSGYQYLGTRCQVFVHLCGLIFSHGSTKH